jgi:hypothetical protein
MRRCSASAIDAGMTADNGHIVSNDPLVLPTTGIRQHRVE